MGSFDLDKNDAAIIDYMKRAYNLMIGERTAEDIKIRLGSAAPLTAAPQLDIQAATTLGILLFDNSGNKNFFAVA